MKHDYYCALDSHEILEMMKKKILILIRLTTVHHFPHENDLNLVREGWERWDSALRSQLSVTLPFLAAWLVHQACHNGGLEKVPRKGRRGSDDTRDVGGDENDREDEDGRHLRGKLLRHPAVNEYSRVLWDLGVLLESLVWPMPFPEAQTKN